MQPLAAQSTTASSEHHRALIRVIWASDGEEGFDDGSNVLQFDVDDKVRLIAFVNTDAPEDMFGTIKETWLDADAFYEVLSRWSEQFEARWAAMPKRNGYAPIHD